jgi:hypothetical protein
VPKHFPAYRTGTSKMCSNALTNSIHGKNHVSEIIEAVTHLAASCHGFIRVERRIANQHLVHDCS